MLGLPLSRCRPAALALALGVCAVAAGCTGESEAALPELPTGQIGGSPEVSPSSPSSAAAAVDLTCENVFDVALPETMAVNEAAGWLGPDCQPVPAVRVTWTAVAGQVPPEVTDAAFVSLQADFRADGWTVGEPELSESPPEVAECDLTSPTGLVAVLRYSPAADDPAELEVEFTA